MVWCGFFGYYFGLRCLGVEREKVKSDNFFRVSYYFIRMIYFIIWLILKGLIFIWGREVDMGERLLYLGEILD